LNFSGKKTFIAVVRNLPGIFLISFAAFCKMIMKDIYCPNYSSCRLVNSAELSIDQVRRRRYIENFCHAGEDHWKTCKRMMVKNKFHFCPDFVLPDTGLTPDEIIDKFEHENIN
jgi:hypothetical protein